MMPIGTFQFKYYRGYSPIYTAQFLSNTTVKVSWDDDVEHHIKAGSRMYDFSTVQELIEKGRWLVQEAFEPIEDPDLDLTSIL